MSKDLTIIIPGIHPEFWTRFYDSVISSIGKYTFDIIFVGPLFPTNQELDNNPNVTYLKSYSAPTRCTQIAGLIANSEFVCWSADDSVFLPDALSQCLDIMYKKENPKDFMCLRYWEGHNFCGNDQSQPMEYWNAHYHAPLRIPGIPESYKLALIAMYRLKYFLELGGLDCRYEPMNMCLHDLSFRAQNDGGTCHMSPMTVANVDHNPNPVHPDQAPIQQAYHQNDLPYFLERYSQPHDPTHIKIDYNNWRNAPAMWGKRFSVA